MKRNGVLTHYLALLWLHTCWRCLLEAVSEKPCCPGGASRSFWIYTPPTHMHKTHDQEIKTHPRALCSYFFPVVQQHRYHISNKTVSKTNLRRLWLGRGIHCHQSICKENNHHKFSLVVVTLLQLLLLYLQYITRLTHTVRHRTEVTLIRAQIHPNNSCFGICTVTQRQAHTLYILNILMTVDVFQHVRMHCRGCDLQQLMIAVSVLALLDRSFLFHKRQYKSLLNILKKTEVTGNTQEFSWLL